MTAADDASRVHWLGYTGWLIAAVGFFYAWVLRISPSLMVGEFMAEFQIGGAVVGVLSSLYFYTYAAMQVPVGLTLDRWGPRRVLTLALVVTAVGCILSGFATGIGLVYAGRLLIGFGAAFALVGSMVLSAAWFPPRRFALLSGLAMLFGLMGGAFGQYLLAAVLPAVGWRASMHGLGAFGLLLAAVSWAFTRDRRPPAAATAAAAGDGGGFLAGTWRTLASLWRVARHRQVIVTAVTLALSSAPILTFGALWGVPYGQVAHGIAKADAAFYVSFLLYGVAVGGPSWGWLSDRIGQRKPPLIVGLLISAVAWTVMLYVPDLPVGVFAALVAVAGFGGSSMNICYAAGRESLPPRNTGAALGVINMCAVALGGIVYQPVVGSLLDMQWTGTMANGARVYSHEAYQWAFAIIPAAAFLALVSAFFLKETRCRPVADPDATRAPGAAPA